MHFLPAVLSSHLHLFQLGEKLHYVTEVGEYKHLFNAFPHNYVEVDWPTSPGITFGFTDEFRRFYQQVFFAQIEPWLALVLFGLQALHQQLGVR